MLACDVFTVETAWLRTVSELFFIALGPRRRHLAGCTAHPTSAGVTQQARNLSWTLQDESRALRFVIRDRDTTFCPAFDTVFTVDDLAVVRTLYRPARAKAITERWIRSARGECLDHLLIRSERWSEFCAPMSPTTMEAYSSKGWTRSVRCRSPRRQGRGPLCGAWCSAG